MWPVVFSRAERALEVRVVGEEQWRGLLSEIAAGLGTAFELRAFVTLNDLETLPIPAKNGGSKGGLLVVADPDALAVPGFHRALNRVGAKGMRIELLPNLAERALGRIPLEVAETFRSHYYSGPQFLDRL